MPLFIKLYCQGFYFANSLNGIVVEAAPEDSNITIYNNFEGALFKYDGYTSEFPIIYKNEDFVVNLLSEALATYSDINKKFETDGVLSPSGKFKYIYTWFLSENEGTNPFIYIRTLDFSEPDFDLGPSTNDARWLSDDYILYINMHTHDDCPYIFKISSYRKFSKDYNVNELKDADIDVLDKLKINTKGNNSNRQCKITDVKNNIIFLETLNKSGNKKTYKIKYWFDKSGAIQLSI